MKTCWIGIHWNKFFLQATRIAPFIVYTTQLKVLKTKVQTNFHHNIKFSKMYLRKTMSTYCHNTDHMTLQLNYKECNNHLNPGTTSFKISGIKYEITLMKVFSKTSYNVQNHLHVHQYYLWRSNMGISACVWIIITLTKSPQRIVVPYHWLQNFLNNFVK